MLLYIFFFLPKMKFIDTALMQLSPYQFGVRLVYILHHSRHSVQQLGILGTQALQLLLLIGPLGTIQLPPGLPGCRHLAGKAHTVRSDPDFPLRDKPISFNVGRAFPREGLCVTPRCSAARFPGNRLALLYGTPIAVSSAPAVFS